MNAMVTASGSATVRREGGRLAWYRQRGADPHFWEAHWQHQPAQRIRNLTLPVWYREVLFDVLPNDGLIVEAGCGNGLVVQSLTDRGFDIEGIDFAEQTVRSNAEAHPEGKYRTADVRDLPYSNGSIGAVISLGVIEHFGDHDRARILAEAVRCLRPGGVAVVSVPYFSPLRMMRCVTGGFRSSRMSGDASSFYQYAFTRQDLVHQVSAAGLRVDRIDAYGVRKGVKDTIGNSVLFRAVFGSGENERRWMDHPPRLMRLLGAHMLLVVARKP